MTEAAVQSPPLAATKDSNQAALWLVAGCVVAAVVKFWMIRSDEIVAAHSALDGLWYLTSAKFWYWNRPYDYIAFVRLPGYPLWAAAVHSLGVPLRLAGEFLLIGSAFVFVTTLVRVGLSRTLAWLMFVAIVFQPSPFVVYNHPTPDTIYAPLLLLALAASVRFCFETDARRRVVWAIVSGLPLAWMWISREESPLVVVYLISLGIVLFFILKRRSIREIATTILLPAVPIAAVVLGVCAINHARFGIFATSDFSSPGFLAANRALMRITPKEGKHIVPVTLDSRQKAYEHSPAFRELQSFLEGKVEVDRATLTQDQFGQMDEIPSGGWVWFFREAANLAGHHKSAREANEYYQKVADEINAACGTGKLTPRFTISATIDPSFGVYLPWLPNSFLRQAVAFGRIEPRETDEMAKRPPTPNDIAIFDEMASRRGKLLRPGGITVTGWAFDSKDPVVRIHLRSGGKVLGSTDQFTSRPDVPAAFPEFSNVPANTGFSISGAIRRSALDSADLAVVKQSGAVVRVPMQITETGKVIVDAPVGATGRIFVDEAVASPLPSRLEIKAQNAVWFFHGWAVRILSCAGIAALIVLIIFRRGIDRSDPAWAILALLAMVVGARLALLTFIDAMSGPTSTILRYMYPVTYLYTCGLLILIAQAVRVARAGRKRYAGMG